MGDAVVREVAKKANSKELEEWICGRPESFLYNCVSKPQTGIKGIEKYLVYDWNNASEAAKKALADQLHNDNPLHPLEAIAIHKDPTHGKLINLCLDNAIIDVKGLYRRKEYGGETLLRLAGTRGNLIETELFLKHGSDTLESNGETLNSVIHCKQIEILRLFSKYAADKPLFYRHAMEAAAKKSFKVLKFLIEEEKQVIEGRFPYNTILQLLLIHRSSHKESFGPAEISYILPLVRDINETDSDGNAAIFYLLKNYSEQIAELIFARNPSMDVIARNFCGEENILSFAARMCDSEALWRQLDARTTLEHWKWANQNGETLLHRICLCGSEYTNFRIVFDSLKKKDLLRVMLLQPDLQPDIPVFVAISQLYETEMELEENSHVALPKCASLRAVIRVLLQTAAEMGIELGQQRDRFGKTVDNYLAQFDLLPADRRFSSRLFKSDVPHNLGDMTKLPRDVLLHVFQHLTLREAVELITVNKKFFQLLTCSQVWTGEFGADQSTEQFSALCNTERVKQRMNSMRENGTKRFFAEVIEVSDGEGILEFEAGFIHGLKFRGKHVVASFCDPHAPITKVDFVHSSSLSAERSQYATKLEELLHGGLEAINFSTLVHYVKPFMNLLHSGIYLVSLWQNLDLTMCEYDSNTTMPFSRVCYPNKKMLLFTRPSDLLDRARIEFYKDEILAGKRPIILLLFADRVFYLIDGHHKMVAYKETQNISKAIFISIEIKKLKKSLSRAEEIAYLGGINGAISAHRSSSKRHEYEHNSQKEEEE